MLKVLRPARAELVRKAAYARMQGLRVVLDGIEDCGNRAAIMRSAEAFGLLHVHELAFKGGDASSRHAKARALLINGGEKWLNIHTHSSSEECCLELQRLGFLVCAGVAPPGRASQSNLPQDTKSYKAQIMTLAQIDFGKQVAVVFGNERFGVSEEMLRLSDIHFTIPLRGLSESLSVGAAAAVVIHFGRVSREAALGADSAFTGDLSQEMRADLERDYIRRAQTKGFQRTERRKQYAPIAQEIGDSVIPDVKP
mmetsp:Transcript_11359/g.24558  ORF Transcript_11359/g.24558 Transcript_11359/m.24558 type:complete len:254 (-) Transcript_11359:202-963(-)